MTLSGSLFFLSLFIASYIADHPLLHALHSLASLTWVDLDYPLPLQFVFASLISHPFNTGAPPMFSSSLYAHPSPLVISTISGPLTISSVQIAPDLYSQPNRPPMMQVHISSILLDFSIYWNPESSLNTFSQNQFYLLGFLSLILASPSTRLILQTSKFTLFSCLLHLISLQIPSVLPLPLKSIASFPKPLPPPKMSLLISNITTAC